jgi:hypothetical protein
LYRRLCGNGRRSIQRRAHLNLGFKTWRGRGLTQEEWTSPATVEQRGGSIVEKLQLFLVPDVLILVVETFFPALNVFALDSDGS